MKAIALLLIILGFHSPDTRAQVSRQPHHGQPDSTSFNSLAPAPIQIKKPNSSLRVQVYPRWPLPMDADMTLQHLPFFCRQEFRFEKVSGIPLRMRLGSVQQTDWLEQKVRTATPW